MESKKPLLSICIPTYNRDYLIQECLKRLCPIAIKYNVQIHISDNASQDDTENVINGFMKQYDNIFYYRQTENIFDKNFEFILKQPKTKYRWLFGDNVVISEDMLMTLIDDLNNNEFDFYVIGCENRTEKLTEKIYTSKNDLLSDIGWHITFISCLIYNSIVIDKIDIKHYYNSHFLQTAIIFEYCAYNTFKLKFTPQLIITGLPYPKRETWTNKAFDIFSKGWFLFVMSLPVCYEYEAKKECIISHDRNTKLFSIQNLRTWRRLNYFNIKIILHYKFFISQTVLLPFPFLLFISIIPISLFDILGKIKRALIKLWK